MAEPWPRMKLSARITRIGIFVVMLGLWEVLPRSGLVPPIILAPISSVLEALWKDYGRFFSNLQVTLLEIVVAISIAWGLGLISGVVIGSNRVLGDLLVPLVSSLYAVPIVIIYPVLSAWFGLGLQSKYLLGGIYGFFPVLLNTVAGIRSIEGRYFLLAKSLGASKIQTIIRIIVPLSLPGVIPGIRLGAALAVIGVVVAEMLASSAGIGFLIEYNRTIFKTSHVYLAILIVIGIVGIIDRLMFFLEKKLVYWK